MEMGTIGIYLEIVNGELAASFAELHQQQFCIPNMYKHQLSVM